MLNISMTNDVAGRVRLLVHRSIRQRAFQANTNITNQIRSRATYCPWARLPVKSHANTSTRCSLLKTYLRDWIHQFNAGGNITNLKERIYDKLILVTSILQKQSNVYITLRVRQFAQLINLYHRLYSPSEFRQMFIATLLRRLNLATVLQNGRQSSLMRYFAKRRHLLLSLATCSVFSWNADGIRDKEFEDLVNEFALFEKMKQKHTPGSLDIENNQIENYKATTIDQHSFMVVNCLEDDQSSKPQSYSDWEVIINRPNFSVLRKAVQNTSLYEYKGIFRAVTLNHANFCFFVLVFGSFFDISAYSFYLVQMDLDFRKEWDNLVLKLSVIEKESNASLESAVNVEDTGNELIHWVMKFPVSTLESVFKPINNLRFSLVSDEES